MKILLPIVLEGLKSKNISSYFNYNILLELKNELLSKEVPLEDASKIVSLISVPFTPKDLEEQPEIKDLFIDSFSTYLSKSYFSSKEDSMLDYFFESLKELRVYSF